MARERVSVAAPNAELRAFASRDELASTLAAFVAGQLSTAIARKGAASLAVSGGTTPGLFFRTLSEQAIDWANVDVTLVDERLVPETNERSNARLVRQNLLQNEAAKARFVPLYSETQSPQQAARNAEVALALSAIPVPLDVVVLGMGTDGHTASFFPDARSLDALLDPRNTHLVEAVDAPSAGEPRLTLPLARLIEAPALVLHIEGTEKRKVLDAALSGGSDLPIAAVIRAASSPVQIFWAP